MKKNMTGLRALRRVVRDDLRSILRFLKHTRENDERAALRYEMKSNVDSHTSSVGPLCLDLQMARRHGWTEAEIVRAALVMGELSRLVAGGAVLRHPELYRRADDGTLIFLGPAQTSFDPKAR